MTIRGRLLALLLPTMIVFVTMISLFFYINWYNEIISSFKSQLESIVVSGAQVVDPQKIAWISEHVNDPNIEQTDLYSRYYQKLYRLKEKLPITNFYIVRIEPVSKGEPVLLNQPQNSANRVFDGGDKAYAYRQIYLLDASGPHNEPVFPLNHPGDSDFSESQEHTLYYTKEPIVTQIYESEIEHQRFMTAYAPIVDSEGKVIGLMAADFSLKLIDQKLHNAIVIIVLSAVLTIFLVTISVYFISGKISKPVNKLKNSALAIAAGNYEEDIHVEGPREIVELANTLNTMSECLEESISRLRESSAIRERMYGEYECGLLLQYYMLDGPIEEFSSPDFEIKVIKHSSTKTPLGLFLKLEQTESVLWLNLAEANEVGFQGNFNLLAHFSKKIFSSIQMTVEKKKGLLKYTVVEMPHPLVWSIHQSSFLQNSSDEQQSDELQIDKGDLIFLCSNSFVKQFENSEKIQDWFAKVLRHFAEESLDICMAMLKSELNYFVRNLQVDTDSDMDLHIICLRNS